jgi:DNA polymerase-3 subunit delta
MAKGEFHLFLGPEIGEKTDAIRAVRESIKKTSGEAPEETSFYAGDTPFPDILSVLLNGSLFSSSRLILIKNAELIKKKQEVDALASFVAGGAPGTTLILISDGVKVESGVEKLFQKEKKRIFWELFEEEKEHRVVGFFKKEGFAIEAAAVSAILEMTENNTAALRQECTRIALYLKKKAEGAGQRAPITEEAIRTLLESSKQENAFSLFSALARGDMAKSIDIERTILAAGEAPQAIFGALTYSFRKFRDYCLLAAHAQSNDFELKKIGINARAKKDFSAARRIYGDAADACLSLIAEYDIMTRAQSALSGVLMDLFVYKIASLGHFLPRTPH